MRPTFDDKDEAIRQKNLAAWNKVEGPRVGDYVILSANDVRRFTHDWGDTLQTTVGDSHPCNGDSSFYFGEGYMSFSGSLDRGIPKGFFVATGEVRDGSAWFFHHGSPGASRGVHFPVPCRVFRKKC